MMLKATVGKPVDLVLVSPRVIDKFIVYYRSGNTTIQIAEIPARQIAIDKYALSQPLVLEYTGHYIVDAVDSNGVRVSSLGIIAEQEQAEYGLITLLRDVVLFILVIFTFILFYRLINPPPIREKSMAPKIRP